MHSPDIHSVLTVANKYTQKYSDFPFSLLRLSPNNLNMKHKICWGKEELDTYLVLNLTVFHWHINNHLSQWEYKGLKKFLPCLLSQYTTAPFIGLHWSVKRKRMSLLKEKKKKNLNLFALFHHIISLKIMKWPFSWRLYDIIHTTNNPIYSRWKGTYCIHLWKKMQIVPLFLLHDWLAAQQFSNVLANNSRQEECSST